MEHRPQSDNARAVTGTLSDPVDSPESASRGGGRRSLPARPVNKIGDPYDAYVDLARPLPCAAGQLGAGFVVGLATDRLMIQLALSDLKATASTGTPLPAQPLTVSLATGQTYHFQNTTFYAVQPQQATNPWSTPLPGGATQLFLALIPPGDSERPLLVDLLNLVRKDQHIAICQNQDVEASDRYTGFNDLHLRPKAMPELSWDDLVIRQTFLGREFAAPLLITGMTGGLARGAAINLRLAQVAAHFGIPMGVGSQRVALENQEHAAIFSVKKSVAGVFLIGNLGIAQLGGQSLASNLETCQRAIDMIDADALAIHVNILQEVVQVEGDRHFVGLLDRLAELATRLPVPLLVKEVGAGMDPESAQALADRGIKYLDVGGRGGTSWSFIEGQRAASPVTRAIADTFRDWGVPTALSISALRSLTPALDLVATGGIRDGLTMAKALALGARMVGVGLPLLKAALINDEAPFQVVETLLRGLKTAMICSGVRRLDQLADRLVVSQAFATAMQRHGLGESR